MSYLVLARKWRPQSFEDLVGQASITRILRNSVDQSRIAHAYLFSGPRGVGKTSTARILSKALNCLEGPTSTPCGKCDFCLSITYGSSIDVIEIDGASNNSVDDIRDLREKVKYAPSAGKYKVYIIDEAHMLSQSAFNALLKTLEEPPSHTIFVLATTAPNKVPVTVLSRCQHLPFKRIPSDIIEERLSYIVSNEKGISITESALKLLARAADGSMRDGLTLLDQISAFSEEITDDDIRILLGISDSSLLIKIAGAVLAGDRKSIFSLTGIVYESGIDIRDFSRSLISLLRTMLTSKVMGSTDSIVDHGEDEKVHISEILSNTSEEHLTLLLEALVEAENHIRLSSYPRVALEMSLIKSSFLSKFKHIGDVMERLSGGVPDIRVQERDVVNSSEDKRAIADTEEPASFQSDTQSGEDVWPDIVKRIDQKNHLLACKLDHTKARLSGDTLSIIFNGGFAVHADSVMSQKKLIESIATEVTARKISVVIETKKKMNSKKDDITEIIMNDPLVKETLELFDGRVVDVRPRKVKKRNRFE